MGTQHSPASGRHSVRTALAILVPVAAVLAVLLIWLWPPAAQRAPSDTDERVNGRITAVHEVPCPPISPDDPGYAEAVGTIARVCGTAEVALGDGTKAEVDLPSGPGVPVVKAGDDVVLVYLPDTPGGAGYQLVDHQRGDQLWILAAALALAVIAFGRLRGLAALAGLGVTFAVLVWFIVPAILAGRSPLLVAIAGAAAIMFVVLYLTHGLSRSTSVAVAGTLISLAFTAVLGWLSVGATHLTGYGSEDAFYTGLTMKVNMQGLLLAGIVIGALGVLDDVTVTQAVTVDELAGANPSYRFGDLYKAATRVGRAHIASVVNTIILAYAGASLPLLLLIAASDQPAGQILTNQALAEELVRGMVGTIGLVAAVPITTALAAFVTVRTRHPKPRPVLPAEAEESAWDPAITGR